jgi:tRNA (mo5U34)-methyltransferase
MPAATAQQSLHSRVEATRWYHTLELPGGVLTPGEYDLRGAAARLPIPDDLSGMRCLDIGGRDGFYAFEMERRGAAEVVSVDIDDPAAVDFPGARPDPSLVRSELDAGNRAFELARGALSSGVERRWMSVYDLDAGEMGQFDFAVIGTLLLHLRDPARALVAIRPLIRGRLLINEPVIAGVDSLRRRPLAELRVQGGPFWWQFNPAGLRQLAEAAGFEVLRSGRPYLIPYGPGGPRGRVNGPARALRPPLGQVPERLLLRRGLLHCWILSTPSPDVA